MWWRVEFDAAGLIVSCEQVEERGKDGGLVAFVEGANRLEARNNVVDWYRRYRAQQCASSKRLRARRKAEGRCAEMLGGCLGKTDGPYVTCSSCRAKKRAHDLKLRTVGATRPPTTPEQARAAYLRTHSRTLHAQTVLKMFDSLGAPAFRRWLVQYIADGKIETARKVARDPMITKRGASARPDSRHAAH